MPALDENSAPSYTMRVDVLLISADVAFLSLGSRQLVGIMTVQLEPALALQGIACRSLLQSPSMRKNRLLSGNHNEPQSFLRLGCQGND